MICDCLQRGPLRSIEFVWFMSVQALTPEYRLWGGNFLYTTRWKQNRQNQLRISTKTELKWSTSLLFPKKKKKITYPLKRRSIPSFWQHNPHPTHLFLTQATTKCNFLWSTSTPISLVPTIKTKTTLRHGGIYYSRLKKRGQLLFSIQIQKVLQPQITKQSRHTSFKKMHWKQTVLQLTNRPEITTWTAHACL